MSLIEIKRRHGLSTKKARQAAEHIAEELAAEFDIAYAWQGNTVEFSRTGVSGTIEVGKKEVEIRAKLGLVLALLRPKIEREIHRFCDENFGPEE